MRDTLNLQINYVLMGVGV